MGWADAPVESAAPPSSGWASAPIADDAPTAPPSAPPEQPNMALANSAFGRGLATMLQTTMALGAKRNAGDVASTVEGGVEAAANTIVGLGAFPVSVLGAPLSAAHQWLSGEKNPESIGDAFDRLNTSFTGPLYEQSGAKGQDYTDKIGDLFNNVLIPLGGHFQIHPSVPESFASSYRELPPIIQAEMTRKVTGQRIDSADMQNVAKVTAGPGAPPETVATVEKSLRSTYAKTGIGPFTIADAAKKDPQLLADLKDPNVDVPGAIEPYLPKPEPNEPVPGDGKPLLDTTSPDAQSPSAIHPDAIPTETLEQHGLLDTPETRQQLSGVALAATINEGAVRRAAVAHEDDEPAFHQAIQEIIHGSKEEGAVPGGGRAAAGGQEPGASAGQPRSGADAGAAGGNGQGTAAAPGRPVVPELKASDVLPPDLHDTAQAVIAANPKGEAPSLLTKQQQTTATKELAPAIQSAEKALPAFDAKLHEMGETLGARVMTTGVKSGPRLLEKHVLENNGNLGKMRDLVRGSLVVDSRADVPAAIAEIRKNFDVVTDEGGERLKDRFASPLPTGYSDVLMNVKRPDGGVAEIQIHVPEMIAAKDVGHKIYDVERKLADDHPDKPGLVKLQSEIYAAALRAEEARSASKRETNAARDSSSPQARILDDKPGYENSAGENALQEPSGSRTASTPSTSKNLEPSGKSGDFISTSEPILPGEQPSSAPARPESDLAQAGANPLAALADFRDGYSNYVGVEADHAAKPAAVDSQGKPISRFGDDLLRVLAPASRGEIASKQAGIMRANFGEMAREAAQAETRLFDFAKTFDAMPVAENVKFIDAYEHGTKLTDPKLAAAADALKSMNDQLRKQIQDLGTGQLENFDENYLGRIWKDPETAGRDLYARRPLEGNKNFLKARTIPFYTDGLQWRAYDADNGFLKSFPTEAEAKAAAGAEGRVGEPLKPITTNPVEMALLKAKEMRKYVYGQRIFQEMKDADLARFVGFGQQALPGWVKIDDKIGRVLQPADGGGMILRGDYYSPDEAGTLLNNHLKPSALQGNSFFEGWRMLGNAVNAMQLGLSFFHVGFTSMDAIISKAALGMKQISRGDLMEGAGNVGMAMTGPVQSIANLIKGDRLLKAYNGGTDSPELSPLVQAIEQAGGRVKIDDFYRNEAVNTFRQALRNEQYGAAAKSFLPTVLDRVSAPIFEWLVPRQKLGVFADMANDWIAHNQDAGLAERREGLGKLWDSVDNRMGQLVYDNVFWNRTLKDGLMATVRSVGWNLGTFREIGGGVLDIKNVIANKGFSDRTAYIVALPMMAAAYGSVMHYLYNGSPPEDLKDAFYPRTGRIRPDGSPDRVSLPTYMKDVFAYGEDAKNFAKYGTDPTQTLKNKAHPLIATMGQMLNNQDFFGGAIRNPADPAVQQVADEARFLIQQFEPFSYRNYIQQAKEKGEEPTAIGYLTSPSMIGITPAPGYMTKTDEQLESAQVSRMREPLIMKYREAIKNGADPETLIPEMIKGGLSKSDIKYVIKSSGETPKPSRLKKFGSDEPNS